MSGSVTVNETQQVLGNRNTRARCACRKSGTRGEWCIWRLGRSIPAAKSLLCNPTTSRPLFQHDSPLRVSPGQMKLEIGRQRSTIWSRDRLGNEQIVERGTVILENCGIVVMIFIMVIIG